MPFKSGGEVMTNLLGGHVDAAWANPSECIGQLEAGQVRALAVGDEERLKGLPKIQTMKELGVAMVSNQWRAVGGPGNLPKPVVDYWVNVLDKVRKTDFVAEGLPREERSRGRLAHRRRVPPVGRQGAGGGQGRLRASSGC